MHCCLDCHSKKSKKLALRSVYIEQNINSMITICLEMTTGCLEMTSGQANQLRVAAPQNTPGVLRVPGQKRSALVSGQRFRDARSLFQNFKISKFQNFKISNFNFRGTAVEPVAGSTHLTPLPFRRVRILHGNAPLQLN
jgi:hypothetical protein